MTMPMPTGGGFRIASGFVEITTRTDQARMRRNAQQAGQDVGRRLGLGYVQAAEKTLAQQQPRMSRAAAAAARSTGMQAAAGMAAGITQGQKTVVDAAGKAGAAAGEQFYRDAKGRLRNSKGHFVKEGEVAGAATAAGMAAGLKQATPQITDAAGQVGTAAGERYTRDALGRLRDSRGKFVKESEVLGSALGAGIPGAGTQAGTGFSAGLSAGLSGGVAAATGAAAVIGGALGTIGWAVLDTAGTFEHSMQAVRAVTNATGADFSRLEGLAKELGSTTMFSATEAANAMEFLGMAGWDTTQILEGLPAVLDLAASGGLGLAEAADIASNIMAAMSMEASEVGRASDALAKAAASANVNVSMLGETASYAAGTASAAGWSIEQLALATGLFGNVGIQGSMAGTALNYILGQLQNSSSKAAKLFGELGIEIYDASGNVRGFDELLLDLMDSEVEASELARAFGAEHGPKLVSVLEQGEESVLKLADAMDNTAGEAERMASIRMDSFVGSLDGAKSAVEGLLIAVGDMGILDTARGLVDSFAAGVQGLTEWMSEHEEIVTKVVTVIGGLVAAFGAVIGTVLAVKGAIAAGGAAIGLLTGPIGWVTMAVFALGAGLVAAWKKSETFRKVVSDAFNLVKDAAETVADFFTERVWPILRDGWEELSDAAGPIVNKIIEWFGSLGEEGGLLAELWSGWWDEMRQRAQIVWDALGPIAESGLTILKEVFSFWAAVFEGDWDGAWESAKTILSEALNAFVEIAKATAKLWWENLKTWFVELPSNIYNWLVENVPVIRDQLAAWADEFIDWAKETAPKVLEELKEFGEDIGEWITDDMPPLIEEKTREWTNKFIEWAKKLPGRIKRWLGDGSELMAKLREWGPKLAMGLVIAIGVMVTAIPAALAGVAALFLFVLGTIAATILQALVRHAREWMQGVAEEMRAGVETAVGWFKALPGRIIAYFEELYDKLVGNSIIPDLVDKILWWLNTLPGAIAGILTDMKDRAVAKFTEWRDQLSNRADEAKKWVVDKVKGMRDDAVKWATDLKDKAVQKLREFRDGANDIASKARDWVVSKIRSLVSQALDALGRFKAKAISAFKTAKDGIAREWGKLKEAAKAPVKFVIDTVYNRGIVSVWNKVANKVNGLSTITPLRLKGFRRGGVLPGYSHTDDQIIAARSGEGILVPRAVKALGGREFIDAVNRGDGRGAEEFMRSLPGFQRGGIVGQASRWLDGFTQKLKDGFREGFAAAARGALSPYTNLAATMFGTGQDYPGIGYWITRQAVNKVIDHLIPFGKTLEGGEKRRRVVEIANQQVGISGTPNKFTAPFFNAAWCGMFVDWVFKKAGVHGALSKVRHGWTPLVANYTTLPKVPLSQALPGDLPLYRSDAGHINILTDPAKRQTVGGNESNAVRRRIGYVNSASSIRRPDFQGYAQGGIVDAAAGLAGLRDLVWQDAVETPFTTAGEQHLREVLARPPWAGSPVGMGAVSGTHDDGGWLPDGGIAINKSGRPEPVLTHDQWQALLESRGCGPTFTGDIHVTIPARDLAEMQQVAEFFARLQQEARRHGARTRVGAPR